MHSTCLGQLAGEEILIVGLASLTLGLRLFPKPAAQFYVSALTTTNVLHRNASIPNSLEMRIAYADHDIAYANATEVDCSLGNIEVTLT